jgi:hypothetical protein
MVIKKIGSILVTFLEQRKNSIESINTQLWDNEKWPHAAAVGKRSQQFSSWSRSATIPLLKEIFSGLHCFALLGSFKFKAKILNEIEGFLYSVLLQLLYVDCNLYLFYYVIFVIFAQIRAIYNKITKYYFRNMFRKIHRLLVCYFYYIWVALEIPDEWQTSRIDWEFFF